MKHPDLVAVDASLASERAVSYAVAQARHDERPLVFVHVVEPIERRDDEHLDETFVKTALQTADAAGVSAEARILRGHVREQIISAAQILAARFIFIGTSGLRGLERWILGSVAADVVRHSEVPVIVVPPVAFPSMTDEPLFSRMLVTINPEAPDVSPACSVVAFAKATQRAIVFCAAVDEVHLVTLVAQSGPGFIPTDLIPSLHAEAHRAIDSAIAMAANEGVASEGVVVSGEPVNVICTTAYAKHVTAIVIGTHARRGLPLLFLGSTTTGVLNNADIPVVTLHLGHAFESPGAIDLSKTVVR